MISDASGIALPLGVLCADGSLFVTTTDPAPRLPPCPLSSGDLPRTLGVCGGGGGLSPGFRAWGTCVHTWQVARAHFVFSLTLCYHLQASLRTVGGVEEWWGEEAET